MMGREKYTVHVCRPNTPMLCIVYACMHDNFIISYIYIY